MIFSRYRIKVVKQLFEIVFKLLNKSTNIFFKTKSSIPKEGKKVKQLINRVVLYFQS